MTEVGENSMAFALVEDTLAIRDLNAHVTHTSAGVHTHWGPVAWKWLDRSGVWHKHCSTEFRKQVLPKLGKPGAPAREGAAAAAETEGKQLQGGQNQHKQEAQAQQPQPQHEQESCVQGRRRAAH